MKILCLIVASSLLYGCASCGPASWAEEAEARFQCGMSVEDVRKIAGRDVEQRDVPRDWSTHAIRDGSTDLWLGFPEGKLRFTQILWAQR